MFARSEDLTLKSSIINKAKDESALRDKKNRKYLNSYHFWGRFNGRLEPVEDDTERRREDYTTTISAGDFVVFHGIIITDSEPLLLLREKSFFLLSYSFRTLLLDSRNN